MSEFVCPQCKSTDENLRYPSGKVKNCMDCSRYTALVGNSKKTRKHQQTTPELLISKEEFLDWCRSGDRICTYCSIPESFLRYANQKSQIGLTVAALGIDRIDNAGDYSLGNICYCCFACNKAKGNVFSYNDMIAFIGPAIRLVWQSRGIF